MNVSPKISIVTPCHNRGTLLAQTIETVLEQNLDAWELILVDDGSTDETPEVIRRYCSRDRRIVGVRRPNGGMAKARNFGFAQISSQSEYIFFLDSDDLLAPTTLQVMSTYLDSHPDVGLLTCQMQEIDEAGTPDGSARRSRWVPGRYFPRQMAEDERETPFITFFCETGQGPFALFRKSVFLLTTGYDEVLSCSMHEDTDIFCQMALAAKVHHLPERLYLKRRHGAQVSGNHARIQAGSIAFRRKWDQFRPRTLEEEEVLRHARRYYHRIHAPLRNLKVAFKAFAEFVRTGNWGSLVWALRLVDEAVWRFFGRCQNS